MAEELTSIEVPQSLTVKELSVKLNVDPIDLVKQFMRHGLMYSLNQYIDFEIAAKIAEEFSVKTYLQSTDLSTKNIDNSQTDFFFDDQFFFCKALESKVLEEIWSRSGQKFNMQSCLQIPGIFNNSLYGLPVQG